MQRIIGLAVVLAVLSLSACGLKRNLPPQPEPPGDRARLSRRGCTDAYRRYRHHRWQEVT